MHWISSVCRLYDLADISHQQNSSRCCPCCRSSRAVLPPERNSFTLTVGPLTVLLFPSWPTLPGLHFVTNLVVNCLLQSTHWLVLAGSNTPIREIKSEVVVSYTNIGRDTSTRAQFHHLLPIDISRIGSHWSRPYITALSLVENSLMP